MQRLSVQNKFMPVECVNCGFYVASNDKFCPDCGLSEPSEPVKSASKEIENKIFLKTAGIIAVAVFIGFGLFRWNGDSLDFDDSLRLAATVLLFGTIFSILFVLLTARRSGRSEEQKRFAEAGISGFQFIQDSCAMRNHELSEMRGDLRGSVERGARVSSETVKSNRRQTRDEISGLLSRYELLLDRIDFARLQNRLLPLLLNGRNNSADENFSESLDEISLEIEDTKSSLSDYPGDEIFEDFLNEKRDFLAQVEETEKLCRSLTNRSENLAPFETDFSTLASRNSTAPPEILNAQKTLAKISESFDKLERAYRKLKI